MKTEVYRWRVSSDVKTGLEREARRRKISVAAGMDADDDQRRRQKSAAKWLGTLASGNSQRSETAAQTVRDRLRRRYGR